MLKLPLLSQPCPAFPSALMPDLPLLLLHYFSQPALSLPLSDALPYLPLSQTGPLAGQAGPSLPLAVTRRKRENLYFSSLFFPQTFLAKVQVLRLPVQRGREAAGELPSASHHQPL